MNVLPAQLGAEIQRMGRELAQLDPVPILQKVNTYVAGISAQAFQERKSPDGTPWAGDATGVKTGALRAELTDPGRGVITGNKLERGSTLPQASFMQYGIPKVKAAAGGRRKKRKQLAASKYRTPPRPVMGFVDRHADDIGNIVGVAIVQKWAGNAS